MTVESPKSFNEFSAEYPDMSGQELVNLYFEGLTAYRQQLAEVQGVTLGQLHDARISQEVAFEEASAA